MPKKCEHPWPPTQQVHGVRRSVSAQAAAEEPRFLPQQLADRASTHRAARPRGSMRVGQFFLILELTLTQRSKAVGDNLFPPWVVYPRCTCYLPELLA